MDFYTRIKNLLPGEMTTISKMEAMGTVFNVDAAIDRVQQLNPATSYRLMNSPTSDHFEVTRLT